MHLLSVTDLLPGKAIQALCWMLVHSLWIGLLLTVVTGIIVVATKKQTAHLRYNLLTGTFLAFTAVMAIVFIMEFRSISGPALQQAGTQAATDTKIIDLTFQNQAPAVYTPGFMASIIDFFNRYANIIVLSWFLIIAFRCVRLAGGLYKLHRLRNDQLSTPGEEWINRLTILSVRLNIKNRVRFFQSGIAKVPLVVGHLKPVILFPVGVLTSLPEDEVEAILVHELAHIRRKDYLINMLQTLVEILFFFNPAVLWVSSLIKIERENCCDDIAVAQTSSKRNYINALVSFQEYQLGTNNYAPALAGKKDHLLQRVKRMLNNNNKTLNAMEKTFLMLCLIITTSLSVIFSQSQTGNPKPATDKVMTSDSVLRSGFDPEKVREGSIVTYSQQIDGVSHTTYAYKKNGVLYEISDDVSSFAVNGKLINREQWGQYKAMMDEIRKERQQDVVEIADPASYPDELIPAPVNDTIIYITSDYRIVTENDDIIEVYLTKNGNRLSEEFVVKNKRLLLDLVKKQKADSKRELDKQLAQLDAMNAEAAKKTYKLDQEQQNLNRNISIQDQSRKVDNVAVVTDQSKKVTIKKTVDDEKTHMVTGVTYSVNDKPSYDASYKEYSPSYDKSGNNYYLDKLTNDFIDDLVKEKVILNRDGLSYKMSTSELIVNGKVQPAALHKQLKDKYLKSADWALVYNWRL